MIVLVIVIPLSLGFIYCLRSYLLTFIISLCSSHTEGPGCQKTYHRNEVSFHCTALPGLSSLPVTTH